jgi:hypothetical protein
MRILKHNPRNPRVSLVLLDWGVRESFHILHYLKHQTVDRDAFQVIVVEYYDTVSEPLRQFEDQVDTWLVLDMPRSCYYHKHLMYNVGLLASRGDVLLFGDSDAMVRPTFIETVLSRFERDPLIVYHMDEFRNVRRDMYPFNYPSFEEVLGEGCINNVRGKTKGILEERDPVHARYYGACMCARKQDLIDIGGADEDLAYLGHVCGPYDMTFRLMNYGRRLFWDPEEYLYHTWHPGTDGADNYLGPHDGRNMSTAAFEALCTGRTKPLVENPAIRRLRTGLAGPDEDLLDTAIDPSYFEAFHRSRLGLNPNPPSLRPAVSNKESAIYASHQGLDFYDAGDRVYAVPSGVDFGQLKSTGRLDDERVLCGPSFSAIVSELNCYQTQLLETVGRYNICGVGARFAVVPFEAGPIDFRLPKHRAHPMIVWTDSLAQAREAAARTGAVAETPALDTEAHPAPPSATNSATALPVAAPIQHLIQRVDHLERAVSDIYRSRIWRALVVIGGWLDRIARLFR